MTSLSLQHEMAHVCGLEEDQTDIALSFQHEMANVCGLEEDQTDIALSLFSTRLPTFMGLRRTRRTRENVSNSMQMNK